MAMFLVTSPIVINVHIRGLLAVKTMHAIVQWLENLNIKRNITSMFVNKHRYTGKFLSAMRGQLAGAQLLLRVHWDMVRSKSLKSLFLFLFLFEHLNILTAVQVWPWKTELQTVHKEKFDYKSLHVSELVPVV